MSKMPAVVQRREVATMAGGRFAGFTEGVRDDDWRKESAAPYKEPLACCHFMEIKDGPGIGISTP